MHVITNRSKSLEIAEKAAACGTSIGIFGTASHWNTEATLLAAQRIAEKYELETVPVVVSNTFTYDHMPQIQCSVFDAADSGQYLRDSAGSGGKWSMHYLKP